MNAELVTVRHLSRKAVIYVRQSSPHQVLTNQESLRLQYGPFPTVTLVGTGPPTRTWPPYKDLAPLLGRRIRADIIREHWDEVVRLVASLKAGTVAPLAMLKRLAAYQRQNQLDLAIQELGRIERTLFMLDWLESPQLR